MASTQYGTTWWGQRWLNALSGIDFANRIPRGKTYANTGKVFKLTVDTECGVVKARVKGNYAPFYSVKIEFPEIPKAQQDKLISLIAEDPVVLAKLSARELAPEIEQMAEKAHIRIFPRSWTDLDMYCSCPDSAVPCKHLAAVIYKFSQEIDANPFILFELRGLDIVSKLRERGVDFEQAQQSEMPKWADLLSDGGDSAPLPLSELKSLAFSEIPPLGLSVIGLFKDSPAGYTGKSLKGLVQKAMEKAAKLAAAQQKDTEDRDNPEYDESQPLMRLDSWGRLHVTKTLSWTIHPSKGSGKPYTLKPYDDSDEGIAEDEAPLYRMFSAATDKAALADGSEAVEALYWIWSIASKMVEQGAVVPQIYEPADEVFITRWIPASMSKQVGEVAEKAGRALLSLPPEILAVDGRPEQLSGRALGQAVLGAFIDSYIADAAAQGVLKNAYYDEQPPEVKALLERRMVDTSEILAGDSVRMGLEAWLSPLYLEDLSVKPVIVFEDRSDGAEVTLSDLVDAARGTKEGYDDTDEEGPGSEDGGEGPSLDGSSEVVTEVAEDGDAPDEEGRDLFSNEEGVSISMGFTRGEGGSGGDFIPLSDILGDRKYSKVRFECMRTVARLSSVCPQLSTLLKYHGGEGVVALKDLASVITSSIPAMKLLGVRLIIPRTLNRILSPRAAMKIGLQDGGKSWDGQSMISLSAVMNFDWEIAVGGKALSREQFDELLRHEGEVVRFGSSFVYVDPATTEKIALKLKAGTPPSKQRLIAAALTGRFGGNNAYITKELKRALEKLLSEKALEVPSTLKATLRPYQKRGYSWLVRNMRTMMGSIIADDMGLGKTLQVIAALERLRCDGEFDKKSALVVVPASLIVNWQKELARFAPMLKPSVFYGEGRRIDPKADLILTTYGTLRSSIKALKALDLRVVVIDEAQTIKNSGSQVFRAVRSLKADSMIAMSGTPVENRLSEYWSVMDFANPGLLGTAKDFQKEFASPIEDGHDIEAARRLRRVTAPFIMRRLKSDKKIISDLPDKISKDEYCTLSPAQAALYKAQLDASFDAMRQIGADPGKRTAAIITMITRLKKICNAPEQFAPSDSHKGPEFSGKAMQLMEILDALHKSGRKALVFTQFKEMGALLQKWIGERTGRTPLFINGSVAPSKRAEIVDKFQRDRRERVLVLTLKAAGTGLNLTAASAVIHYDLWWNPAVESQATDRAYRIGQTRNVQVWRLICAHTFEEKINEMIESKKELADMAVNVGEKWIGDMSNRQLEEIFSLSGDGAEDAQAQA